MVYSKSDDSIDVLVHLHFHLEGLNLYARKCYLMLLDLAYLTYLEDSCSAAGLLYVVRTFSHAGTKSLNFAKTLSLGRTRLPHVPLSFLKKGKVGAIAQWQLWHCQMPLLT